MIRLTRPTCPDILNNKGAELNNNNISAYEANPDAFKNGAEKFNFEGKNRVYGESSVKSELIKAQHFKCCFCEAKITHSPGDVEHFRPKGKVDQHEDEASIRPGYFWLAYTWENLMYSCDDCNRRYKKNYFPLKDPSKRALSPNDNIDAEEPLIIDPFTENPEEYIDYRGAEPYSKNGNQKGLETIKRTGLNDTARLSFNEDRVTRLKNAEDLYIALSEGTFPKPFRNKLEKALAEFQLPTSEYSLMIKCAVRDGFQFT